MNHKIILLCFFGFIGVGMFIGSMIDEIETYFGCSIAFGRIAALIIMLISIVSILIIRFN